MSRGHSSESAPATHKPGRKRVVTAVGLAAVGLLTATACSISQAESSAGIDLNPLTELISPKITFPAADNATGISPAVPVTATVSGGAITAATLTDKQGNTVDGVVAPDGQSWTSTGKLKYSTEYRLDVQANGLSGSSGSGWSFKTASPGNLTAAAITPSDGAVVGIGQPVGVRFDETIPDRRAAQEAIKVTTNPPVEGAFYWVNNKEVRWRPADYWAPGTTVTIDVDVFGKDLGNGLFGEQNVHSAYSIGDALVATADDNTKMVTFTRNGEVVKTMPTSMGKNSTPTDNGVYTIGERYDHMVMDSSTYGVPVDSPQGYRTPVDYATRMSYSGIFFHSAPWSVAQQGNTNTSHGCLNLSPADAKWVYDNTKRGDIVVVQNTVGGTLSGTDGLGDWNIPWDQWKAGNA